MVYEVWHFPKVNTKLLSETILSTTYEPICCPKMNLRVVILPAKQLNDGSHKVRIAISHNGSTRYFLTRFLVPSDKNLVNGNIVGVPNAAYSNNQIRLQMNKIYQAFDSLGDTDYCTCSQLVTMIEEKISGAKPMTLHQLGEEYISVRRAVVTEGTRYIYERGLAEIDAFFGMDFILPQLKVTDVSTFKEYLAKKLNPTTVNLRLRVLNMIVTYAIRHNYVKYDVSPFTDVPLPRGNVRDCAISLEQLRAVRDMTFTDSPLDVCLSFVRDIFMLSFYLCGMNLADILSLDLRKSSVSFIRQKTKNRKPDGAKTEFTIQPEAREILNKFLDENGNIIFKGKIMHYDAISCLFSRNMRTIAERCNIEKQFIYYSARKTFAQISNELMIKDSLIEYCIGDTVTSSKKIIGYYISVNQRMADKAIRKVFDAVASDKSIEDLMEEAI